MRKDELKQEAKAIVQRALDEKRELTEDEKTKVAALKEEIRSIKEDEEEEENNGTDDNTTTDTTDDNVTEEVEENTDTEDGEEEEDTTKNKTDNKRNHINMKKNFSLVRAIRSIANNQQMDEINAAVIARGAEEARNAGVSVQGQIQLPMEVRSAVTVTAEGEDVVATDLFDIMQPLRAKNVLAQAGAKFYSNLVGNVQVPIMTKSNVGWEGEIGEAKDGAGTFGHKTLSPKRLTAYVDISKQMIAQDSVDVEMSLRQDLINAINSKLEETVLGDEDKTDKKPEGIFHAVSGTTGITTFAQICEVEADIEDANVLGECKYIMSNKAKAGLRSMAKSSKATQLVMEGGQVDGTQAFNTSNVSGKKYVYGDFSNLAIGSWGGVDVTVDPYTKAKDGEIRIVVNAYVDAQILRPEAFATGTLA